MQITKMQGKQFSFVQLDPQNYEVSILQFIKIQLS